MTYYIVTEPGVRLRAEPSTNAPILVEALPHLGVVHRREGVVGEEADGYRWAPVRYGGLDGWSAVLYLEPVGVGLAEDADYLFPAEAILFHLRRACELTGADYPVCAAIIQQESGWRNWRVHHDGTGHGLIGLDDNGLLPDFEAWAGVGVGRGAQAWVIPPGIQLWYLARTIATFTAQYGSAYNAARVWHRGPGLWRDALGDHYEALIRGHVAALFG